MNFNKKKLKINKQTHKKNPNSLPPASASSLPGYNFKWNILKIFKNAFYILFEKKNKTSKTYFNQKKKKVLLKHKYKLEEGRVQLAETKNFLSD